MEKLTNNFRLNEFLRSKWFDKETQAKVISLYNNTDSIKHNIQKLACQLQTLRDHLSVPITINIAYRPVFYELSKGRSGNSQHTLGKAADIKVKGFTPQQIADEIEKLIEKGDMLQGGLSAYSTFVHYDIRKTKARW
jgi:uncharacterized protein YcbK (DUF882 family)